MYIIRGAGGVTQGFALPLGRGSNLNTQPLQLGTHKRVSFGQKAFDSSIPWLYVSAGVRACSALRVEQEPKPRAQASA